MPKISVIVPVYNVAPYIERCLDSIANQTIKDELEIIVINDGSNDNSEEVIKKYMSEKNVEIKYYSKENEGVAKTRNFGIEKANSPYILFVDADDYIDKSFCEKVKPYIEKDIDIIKFKLQRVSENEGVLEKVHGPIFENLTGEKAFHELYPNDVLLDSPCVYVFKKELFTKNNFTFKQTYHEDFGLIPIVLLVAKSVTSINSYLYNYVQVPNSLMRDENYQKTVAKMEDVLIHYDNMLERISNIDLSKTAKEDIKIYYTNAIILKLNELKEEDQKFFIKQIRKRKMQNNIKVRNLKQLFKKLVLMLNIRLYLKMKN